MKREIKFRWWGIKDKKMYGIFDLMVEESLMEQTDMPLHIALLNCFIPMQYTGLKDRHGKEIYEGDIVKHASFSENGRHEMTVLVGADDCKFIDIGFLCEDDMQTGQSPINEVIGNIYENPELLPTTN